MKVLIKNAIIIDKNSSHHGQKVDILIENGQCVKIDKDISTEGSQIIEGNELYCSIGLCDIGTHLGEPGLEHRETLQSLKTAARRGGYTACAVFSNSEKPLQNASDVEWLKNSSSAPELQILPIGVLSQNMQGSQMVDYIDLAKAGVLGFSDGLKTLNDTGLLTRIMEYTKMLDTCIIHHPIDKHLVQGGILHEGIVSTGMGLKGIPDVAELHMVNRDILLAEYLGRQIILHALSSHRSVKSIQDAKQKNIEIKATVPYLNLIYTDKNMEGYDTLLKVKPVLRSEQDRQGLIEGLVSDVIDVIVSNHVPLEEEVKKLEFPYASDGANGLETCLVACIDHLTPNISLDKIIEKLTQAPRELLKTDIPTIEVGHKADLCIFDKKSWVCTKGTISSISKNSPFIGHQFHTKVLGSILGKDVIISNN